MRPAYVLPPGVDEHDESVLVTAIQPEGPACGQGFLFKDTIVSVTVTATVTLTVTVGVAQAIEVYTHRENRGSKHMELILLYTLGGKGRGGGVVLG